MSDSEIKVLASSAMFMGPGEPTFSQKTISDYVNELTALGHVITSTDAEFITALLKDKAAAASREATREMQQRRLINENHQQEKRLKRANDLLFAVLTAIRDCDDGALDSTLIGKIHDWLKEEA